MLKQQQQTSTMMVPVQSNLNLHPATRAPQVIMHAPPSNSQIANQIQNEMNNDDNDVPPPMDITKEMEGTGNVVTGY